MGSHLLITGTDSGVGKTMLGCALAFAFKVRGFRVGVMKPMESRCIVQDGTIAPRDGPALTASASCDLSLDLVSPYRYQSWLLRDESNTPSFERICECYREIEARSDVTIVEDSGGLAAPIDSRHNFADLAGELGLDPLLVAANRSGVASQCATAVEYAARRGILIRGFILNALDSQSSETLHREAELVARATRVPCLGTVRFKEPVSLSIVEQLM